MPTVSEPPDLRSWVVDASAENLPGLIGELEGEKIRKGRSARGRA